MPRLFQKRGGTWSEILSVFQKQGGTWVEILNIFQKIGGTWTKVFAAAKIPGNTVAPTITGTGYLYSTLTNNSLGTWTNSPTSYTRQWRRGTPPAGGGEPQGYSNITGATSSTYVTTAADDGKYIICQVTATNALGSNSAASNPIYVSKYSPVANGIYTITGSPVVGGTLTAVEQVGTWKATTTNTGDTSPDTFVYTWSRIVSGITQTPPLQEGTSSSYLIQPSDNNTTIAVAVTGTNTGGSATTAYSVVVNVSSVYSFSMGKTLHMSTNCFVSLDNPSASFTTLPNGYSIPVSLQDFWNPVGYKWSNGEEFVLHYDGYKLNQSTTAFRATWQMRFYTNQNYADFKIIRWGSSTGPGSKTVAMYKDDAVFGTAVAGPIAQYIAGQTFRVYYSGSQPTQSVGFTEIVTDSMVPISITAGSADDGYFSVVTSTNQYTKPFISGLTSSGTGTSISTNSFTTGGGYNGFNYVIRTGSHFGTLVASGSSFAGSYSQSGLTSGTTYYVTLTPFNAYSQLGDSVQFSQATTNAPGPFSVNSGSKAIPSGGYRTVTVGWTTSTNGPNYEVQLEGSDDGTTWSVVTGTFETRTVRQTLNLLSSPYFTSNSTTFTNVDYRYFYRATARARNSSLDSENAAYSNGGTSTSLAYYEIPGVAPGTPTLGTITVTKTTASIPYTFPSNTGSNTIDWIQFSLDGISFNNDFTSPYDFTGLTSGTTYTLYYRALNYDKLYSSTLTTTFTTTAAKPPGFVQSITAGTKTNTSIAWSWTAPTVTTSNNAATGYEYAHTQSTATPTSWTAQTGTSVTVSNLTKNTTYYMHVRGTNADGPGPSTYNSASTNNDSFYTVSFNVNGSGGTNPASVTQTTAGGSVTLAAAQTRTGYTFGGWNTNTSGTGTNYNAGSSYTPTADITLYAKWTVAFVTPAPTTPPSFVFSRGLNGATSSTRRNWGWNVSSGMGSYSYVIYTLEWHNVNSTTPPSTTRTPDALLTFGSSGSSAPVSNGQTYNLSGNSTPNYRTMARGSSYAGTNGTTITASTNFSWARAICRVTGTNGTTYPSGYTGFL
jgi:uncharacterized repeat protein (TIGR02543 family)